jgi:NNP family nitrate/nitrite transporter-like MFS transporter
MVLALGMGVANAAVFKLVPRFTPKAVGGAAGIIGGLGAFGGFALPPVLGLFVRLNGEAGYAQGFVVFLGLAMAGLVFLVILKRYTETRLP